jgi:hypothetical protein
MQEEMKLYSLKEENTDNVLVKVNVQYNVIMLHICTCGLV